MWYDTMFLVLKSKHSELQLTHICGKTTLKTVKIRSLIIFGGGEEGGERRGEVYFQVGEG